MKKRFRKYLIKLNWFFLPLKLERKKYQMLRVGTHYGFAFVPKNVVDENSVVYSFGAGEDLHWDIEMVREYACRVHIFDPTPRSVQHFQDLCEKTRIGEDFCSETGNSYRATEEIASKMKFYELALWNEDTSVRFFAPKDESHVSHSIANIQNSAEYIEVKAQKLSTIMRKNGHTSIDFLKLDIEGAEYEVIQNIINEEVNIRVVYVEYHYSPDLSASQNVRRIYESLRLLEAKGYDLVHKFQNRYFTLIKD